MTVSTYSIRVLGGRDTSAAYDSIAGTLTVAGQALTLSTVSTALQAQWANAVASISPNSLPHGQRSAAR